MIRILASRYFTNDSITLDKVWRELLSFSLYMRARFSGSWFAAPEVNFLTVSL